ncbi:MAG: FAD/NAD(P)-binding protein [Cyclobacteriaceae bacterium]
MHVFGQIGWYEEATPDFVVFFVMRNFHDDMTDIAIIGGGLSGTLVAYYMLLADRYAQTIYVFEKEPLQLARGIAYRDSNENHLLNVPAAAMNLYNLPSGDFYQWLQKNTSTNYSPTDFVPRNLFGSYLKELFERQLAKAKQVKVKVIAEEVIDIVKEEDKLSVSTRSGHSYGVAKVVLANGILPPADPFTLSADVLKSGHYQSNPWNFRYLNQIKANQHITLIGSGLTMLDHAVELLNDKGNFSVTAFSRRGFLPLPHDAYEPYDFPEYSIVPGDDIGLLLRNIRAYYKRHKDKGLDWRDLIDRIRNEVPQLWRALSNESKKRFIRHLKPYWEIHRHRAPQRALDVINKAGREGRFKLLKGSIRKTEMKGRQLVIHLGGTQGTSTITTDYLLNSSGLQHDISLTSDPLLKKLLERQYMIPDQTRLGIETDESGALTCNSGRRNIFALGALRRASVFECTAAKEISQQAYLLSEQLIRSETNP